jgi:glycosyltransferase involved in cell wall biosynthesis
VLELEQEECPRFALYLTDIGQVVLTSDPCRRERWFPAEDLVGHLVRAEQAPQVERFPDLLVATSRAFLEAVAAGRFISGLFWLLALRLGEGSAQLATVALTARLAAEVCLEFQRDPTVPATAPAEASLILLATQTFQEALSVAGGGRLGAVLASPTPDVTALRVRCGQPTPVSSYPTNAWEALRRLIDDLGPTYRTCPRPTWKHNRTSYRLGGDRGFGRSADLAGRVTQTGPLYPRLLDRSRPHLAYLLPMCDLGGAERVTANLAREARRRGWVPHLFVAGGGTVRLLAEFRDVFETITALDDPALYGSDRLLGLLGGMDVVINTHCRQTFEAFSALRRVGVRTFCHLHSVPLTQSTGAPCGPPFDAVRFEHSIDGVLVISQKMRHWCLAAGIPAEKVHHIPNAPSFEVSEALVAAALAERAERAAGSPLRVLFSGRFDGEKGLDRLVPLVRQSVERDLPFRWRIVGRAVLGDGPGEKELEPLRPYLHPPVQMPQALTRIYRWADVVILLSRFEGVPLTIIEGQRFGCVAVATAVGAVDEVVEHGRTGFLVDPHLDTSTLVATVTHHLSELQEDRGRLLRMAREAAALRRAATWSRSFEPFARAVEGLLAGRGGRQA